MQLSQIKNKLLSEYQYRIEAHAHSSPVSSCAHVKVPELVKTYADLGYHGLVLTNHFIYDYGTCFKGRTVDEGIGIYLNDYREAVECGKEYGLTVLLGAEIRFTENVNDYLIYGVDEKMHFDFYGYLPYGVENFRKNYKMPRSVFLQAHPFRNGMTEIDPSLLDGIETFNLHHDHNSRVAAANYSAKEHGLKIVIAGTDFHSHYDRCPAVSAIRTRVMPKDSFEFAAILKSGDYLMEVGCNAVIFP